MDERDEDRERIGIDLQAIVREVLLAKPPDDVPAARQDTWRFNRLCALLWGYCQTDLGVPHGSGEDCSSWREDAARVGLDLSEVRGMTWAERARDEEQRTLLAEAMASREVGQEGHDG